MSPDRQGYPPGLLVAVVGPSGAGKDTLIALALERLAGDRRIRLARRVVTRPADAAAEDHDTLDEAGFARFEAAGAFCLTWRAHGLAYGLPRCVLDMVTAGDLVIANLSRRSLDEAARRFPRLAIVEITAPREVLVERIAARGRETPDEIAARLARQVEIAVPPGAVSFLSISNAGTPEESAMRLAAHLCELAGSCRAAASPETGSAVALP